MKLSFSKPFPMWLFLLVDSFHLLLLQDDEDQDEGHDCFIDPVYYRTIKDLARAAAVASPSALMAQGRWVGFGRGEERRDFSSTRPLFLFPLLPCFVCPFFRLILIL